MKQFGSRNRVAVDVSLEATRFRQIYEVEYRSVRRYVGRLSDLAADADDIAQEAFISLWRELNRGTEIASPRAWLFRAASNLVISRHRWWTRRPATESADGSAALGLPDRTNPERESEYRQLVRRALQALPPPMRQGLLLAHAGLTGREIAEVLGVKPSYVGTLILRAHERFRRRCQALGIERPFHR